MLIQEHFAETKKLFGCTDGSICKVALKTHHNKYVVAEDNGKANANQDNLGAWEIFVVTFIGDDKVQFKGHHGKYLVAEADGTVNANRPQASTWETWTVEEKGNGLAFTSYHGKYLVAESNGELNANRNHASTWETFRIVHEGNIWSHLIELSVWLQYIKLPLNFKLITFRKVY